MWLSHSGVYVHRILEPSLVGLLSKYSNVANVPSTCYIRLT